MRFKYLALAFCATFPALAQIPAPQINLSGNIGCQGFPCLNNGTLIMASDANHTMTAQETSAIYIKVTSSVSLTATRNLVAPAGRFPFTIENATTGGQAIQIIGQSGTGVTIPNGSTVSVWNDGTNFVQIGSAGGGIPTSPTNALVKINGSNGAASSILDDGATVTTPETIATPAVKAPTSVSVDFTNGGFGAGLENVTARTPSIVGTASLSSSYGGSETHGNYAFVMVAGSPSSIITYDTTTRTPTVLSTYTVTGCNGAKDPIYDVDRASTTGAGYLYFGCNTSNNFFIVHVSSTGVLSAGASIGITSPTVWGRPLDPVTHIMYVTNFNLGTLTPVDLSSPLSPSLGSVITSSVGGINPVVIAVAPGNGYLYMTAGTDVAHQSYIQIYTTAGVFVDQIAVPHAPQPAPYIEGCTFYTALHDASEVAMVNICSVTTLHLQTVQFLPLANPPLSILVANGYAYIGTDTVNDLIIADVHNPSSPFVVNTITGYTGVLGNNSNFAIGGGYLIAGTSSANTTVYTDLGGMYTPQSFGQTAYYRRLQADTIVAGNIKNLGNLIGAGYLQFGGGPPITSQSSTNSQLVTCAPGGTSTQYCGADGAWHTASGSYTPPTGTGFPHITTGAQDPAARAVDVSGADITGVQATANGGTGEAGTFTGIRKANSASADTAAVAADFPTLNQNTTGSAVRAANLSGGALGSAPYQSGSNITVFIASPTTAGHTFFYGWQPSGSVIAPTAIDGATLYASIVNPTFTTSIQLLSGGTAMTGNQGNGVLLQHSTGTTSSGDGVEYDAAGNVIDSGSPIVTVNGAQTFTNKRINKRVSAFSTNSTTYSINTDNTDVVHITAQTATITGFTMSGTPIDGDTLRISITGTASVPFTLGSSFEASTVPVPTTTSGTARLDMGFFWNTETNKWRTVATQ